MLTCCSSLVYSTVLRPSVVDGRSRNPLYYYYYYYYYFSAVEQTHCAANSKHWFTTSFLQPLPYLVTPWCPKNCQLTSSFLLVLKQ